MTHLWEEEGGGRAGEMSGNKRQRGGEKSERGIGDGGGFRPQVTGLPSLSGRSLSLLVKKTPFCSEEHLLLVFPSFLAVVHPNDGLLSASIFYFSSLFFLTSINCWEDVAFPRHVLECECVVVSQQHLRVLVCVSVGLCVCVSYHLQVNLQITGHVCLLYKSVSLSACVYVREYLHVLFFA